MVDLIESYSRTEQNKSKREVALNYSLSFMIADKIALMLIENHKPKALSDLYPHLFEDELSTQDELQEYKERFKAFATEHNKKRGDVE